MSSLTRRIQKKKLGAMFNQPSTAAKKQAFGMVTRKINPRTGEMQDFHYTKGWR